MKTVSNSFFTLFLSVECGLLAATQLQAACPQDTLRFNELCFLPSTGQPQWAVVTNTGGESVAGAGVELVSNGGSYSLPSGLESIPPGGMVVLVFDGAGAGTNDYSFAGDNKAVLHSEPGLPSATNFLGSPVGFCSLYRVTGAHSKETILDFVAWGASAGDAASDAVEKGIWASKGRFVPTSVDPAVASSGPGASLPIGGTIALVDTASGWAGFPPGGANTNLPLPQLLRPGPGEWSLDSPTVFEWENRPEASAYDFQVSTNAGFAFLYLDKPNVSGTTYRPTVSESFATNTFYWRVRSVAKDGRKSGWSVTGSFKVGIETKAPPPGVKGVIGTKDTDFSVAGLVICTRTGNGLGNTTVQFRNSSTPPVLVASDVTDSSGRFTVAVPSGLYSVSFVHNWFRQQGGTMTLNVTADKSGVAINAEGLSAQAAVTPLGAQKDTSVLVSRRGPTWMCEKNNANDQAWDARHSNPHNGYDGGREWQEGWHCWAVSACMIARYYGGTVTRDEIVEAGKAPDGGLAFGAANGASADDEQRALRFALQANDSQIHYTFTKWPSNEVVDAINAGRPIFYAEVGHVMTIDAYQFQAGPTGDVQFWCRFVNRDNHGARPFLNYNLMTWWRGAIPNAGLTGIRTDTRLSNHTGAGEVNDFDKEVRFQPRRIYPAGYSTMDVNKADSDGDGIADKIEIASWVFPTNTLNGGNVATGKFRSPDVDNDKRYPEVDEDSDNGGIKDGDEDKDHNGIVDAGETDPFNAKDDKSLDLVFCIDNTGSMRDDIDAVKAQAINILNKTATDYPNFRVAVVGYRDYPVDPYGEPDDYLNRDFIAFSTNKTDITAAINSMVADGGNDEQESVYSALLHCNGATTLGGWRKDPVKRKILLMNDAPPHDPEPFSGYTMSTVVAALSRGGVVWEHPYPGPRTKDGETELSGAISVISVFVGSDSATRDFDRLIAEETDGVLVEARTASDVPGAVMAALETINVAPIVKLEVNGAYGQTNILADASKSVDPQGCGIIKYEWDWDGDGVYDQWTFGPVSTHFYLLGFGGKMRVRATAVSGETGTATYLLPASEFMDVTPYVDFHLASPRLDRATGALICDMVLTVSTNSIKTLKDKFWFALPSTTNVMLAFPDGIMTNGMLYVDITSLVTNALAAAGGDLLLSPGEQVVLTGALALYSRDLSLPTGFVFAVWADPPPPAPPTRPITVSLVNHTQSHGQLRVRISGPPRATNVIEASSDLVHWTTVATVTNVTGTFECFDPDVARRSERFYRVR